MVEPEGKLLLVETSRLRVKSAPGLAVSLTRVHKITLFALGSPEATDCGKRLAGRLITPLLLLEQAVVSDALAAVALTTVNFRKSRRLILLIFYSRSVALYAWSA